MYNEICYDQYCHSPQKTRFHIKCVKCSQSSNRIIYAYMYRIHFRYLLGIKTQSVISKFPFFYYRHDPECDCKYKQNRAKTSNYFYKPRCSVLFKHITKECVNVWMCYDTAHKPHRRYDATYDSTLFIKKPFFILRYPSDNDSWHP